MRKEIMKPKHLKTMQTSKTAIDVMFLVFNLSHVDNQLCSLTKLYIRDFLSLSVGSEAVKVESVAKYTTWMGPLQIIGPFRDLILSKSKLKILDSWLQDHICYIKTNGKIRKMCGVEHIWCQPWLFLTLF